MARTTGSESREPRCLNRPKPRPSSRRLTDARQAAAAGDATTIRVDLGLPRSWRSRPPPQLELAAASFSGLLAGGTLPAHRAIRLGACVCLRSGHELREVVGDVMPRCL